MFINFYNNLLLFLLICNCISTNISISISTNSNINQYYSNYFNSKYFNSNYFSYNFNFNSNSNYFISNPNQNTVSYYQSSNYYKSSSSWNHLLTVIPNSYIPSTHHTYKLSVSASYMAPTYGHTMVTNTPYIAPTWQPHAQPTSIFLTPAPTPPPTSQLATLAPTWAPHAQPTSIILSPAPTSPPTPHFETPSPTLSANQIIMSFTTDLSISNVQTNYLDSLAQQSIIIATANSMNISIDLVTFVSSSVSKDQKYKDIRILSFNLVATTKTSIPLQGKYSTFISNPNSLFTALSVTMLAAVSSGSFTNYLVAASMALNSTSTVVASVASITISAPIIISIGSPTYSPTTYAHITPKYNPTKNYYYIVLYIFVSFLIFWLLVYFIIIFRRVHKRNRKLRGSRSVPEIEPISTEHVEFVIYDNN